MKRQMARTWAWRGCGVGLVGGLTGCASPGVVDARLHFGRSLLGKVEVLEVGQLAQRSGAPVAQVTVRNLRNGLTSLTYHTVWYRDGVAYPDALEYWPEVTLRPRETYVITETAPHRDAEDFDMEIKAK